MRDTRERHYRCEAVNALMLLATYMLSYWRRCKDKIVSVTMDAGMYKTIHAMTKNSVNSQQILVGIGLE